MTFHEWLQGWLIRGWQQQSPPRKQFAMSKPTVDNVLPFKRKDDDGPTKDWHTFSRPTVITPETATSSSVRVTIPGDRKFVSLKDSNGIVFYECRWDDARMCYHASGSGIEIWHTNFHTAGEMWSAAHSILMG